MPWNKVLYVLQWIWVKHAYIYSVFILLTTKLPSRWICRTINFVILMLRFIAQTELINGELTKGIKVLFRALDECEVETCSLPQRRNCCVKVVTMKKVVACRCSGSHLDCVKGVFPWPWLDFIWHLTFIAALGALQKHKKTFSFLHPSSSGTSLAPCEIPNSIQASSVQLYWVWVWMRWCCPF